MEAENVKCNSCGAEIGLTDKVCPYCGRALTETAGYRADMDYYKEDSATTKKKADKIRAKNAPLVISVVVMVILLVADIALYYVADRAFLFRTDAVRRESARQYETYAKTMQEYLDDGDYTGFMAFKEVHEIAEWEAPYEDMRLLCEIGKEYASLVSKLEEVTMFGPEASWYRPESDIQDCHRQIRYFYSTFDDSLSMIDEDPYKDYIYDMKAKADLLLEIYLGLDETGRSEFFASSDIRQEAYLEEVLIHD
ncbi:MAG: zinc ribbon domain-containing protein [Lachnospiraceae bacterium]|nr:zinc ribbon domain-containing protein [Lachnospiraceae bacterium]